MTENLSLRGKIDRIDIDPENNRIFIGDYKRSSNSIPAFNDIEEGKSFQIPLYSIAMKEFLMKHYANDIKISGGIYYFYTPLTKKDNLGNSSVLLNNQEHYPSKNNPLENREQLQEVLTNTLSKADNLIERLHEGNIEITDDIENCKYCTFGNICRINERQ